MSPILIITLALLALLVLFLNYIRVFEKLVISEVKFGPYLFAYKEFQGSYKTAWKTQLSVFELLQKNTKYESLGCSSNYFDNPKEVKEQDLRSVHGCLLDSALDLEETRKQFREHGIKVMEASQVNVVEGIFKCDRPLSVFVGIFTKLKQLIKVADAKDAKYGCMELYTGEPGKKGTLLKYYCSKDNVDIWDVNNFTFENKKTN
ncbi:hypothetical protein M0812_06487 [Anaeramoeba flamelloides]|uniref:Uncharacterized protein n=1 Tax=Anaeramoeba flamelloides TaxID=1746091 RepID=A0AAV8A7P6_9EUKA|nr:hypothetical protein M0812_06487 [Anaeramoeba flamelloides]